MAKVIGGTTTTPMRMPESGGGAIYLPASEANYSLLKDYLDKGQSVIIVKDGMHYYCVSRSDSNITFQSTFLEKVNILDYSEGSEEPYDGGTTLLDYADVKSNYDPSSFEPISGVGVAKALVGGGEKPWELIEDATLTEDVVSFQVLYEKLRGLKELHIEAYIVPKDTTITSQKVEFGKSGKCYWTATVNCKANGSVKAIMDVYISPRNTTIFDGTVSAYDYTLSGAGYKGLGWHKDANLEDMGQTEICIREETNLWMRTTAANPMAAGTRIKVWGR